MKPLIKDEDGKFNCTSLIKELVPVGSVVHSYLLYGARLELALASDRRFVCAHTNRYIIYEVWKCLLENPERLHEIVTGGALKFDNENMFPLLQETWSTFPDPYIRASLFFILNQCSEGGLISSGKILPRRLSPLALTHLKNFHPPNFHVILDKPQEYFETLSSVQGADYLLLPLGRFTYNLLDEGTPRAAETTLIKHKKLARALLQLEDQRWIVVYKNHPEVLKLYSGFHIHKATQYGISTTNDRLTEELIIANF